MTVIAGSSSCSDRNSHASELDAVTTSRSLRGGTAGDMSENHPTVYHSGLETPRADSKLEVSDLDVRFLNMQSSCSEADCIVMGLAERIVSAANEASDSNSAKEAATKGTRDGGSVKVMAELHSKGVAGRDTDASRSVTTSA